MQKMESTSSLRSMLALTMLATNAIAFQMPMPFPEMIVKRQAPGTPPINNTFAAITPSKDLEWTPCYRDTPTSQLGELNCARLIVSWIFSG